MGVALRTGVPGSLRPAVLLLLDESHWRPWGHLLHTVRTGETAFDHAHGAGLFDYLAGHPEVASRVQRGHERQLARPRAPRRRDVRLLPDAPGGRRRGRTRPAARDDPRAVPSTARHPLRPASRHRGRSADPRRGGRRRPLRARRRELLRRGARGRRRLHLARHHPRAGRTIRRSPSSRAAVARWRPVRVSSSWSDTSPRIPTRRSRFFTPTWRCSSTSGGGSARRTSMRPSWRAAVSDSPRTISLGRLPEAMGHQLIEAQPV